MNYIEQCTIQVFVYQNLVGRISSSCPSILCSVSCNAFVIESGIVKLTAPYPRDIPISLSNETYASETGPNLAKYSDNLDLLTVHGKFRTFIVNFTRAVVAVSLNVRVWTIR